jgi:hypothetical protein
MNYTKEQLDAFRAKDKRIAFLSVFSSLAESKLEFNGDDEDDEAEAMMEKAFEITDKLFERYPIPNTQAKPENFNEQMEEKIKQGRKGIKPQF